MKKRTNGEGSYTKLSSGNIRYRVKVEFDGVDYGRQSFIGTSKTDAYNKYKEWLASSTKAPIEKVRTVAQWADHWLEVYKRPDVEYKPYLDYKMYIDRHIVPAIGRLKLSDVRPAHIKRLLAEARTKPTKQYPSGKPLSRSSQEKILWALKGIFFTAADNNLCHKDPTQKITLGEPEPKKPSVFTKEHIKVITAFLHEHEYGPHLGIYLYSGLRPGEGIGLMWVDHDPDNMTFHVRRSMTLTEEEGYQITPGIKKKDERIVAYNKALRPLLDKLPRNSIYILSRPVTITSDGASKTIYTNHTHGSYLWLYKKFFKALNEKIETENKNKELKAQIPPIPFLSPHKMRHTYATFLRKGGADLDEVRELLGHKSISTTQIYDTVDLDDMKNSVQKLSY